MIKQVLVVRKDLNMRKGKIAAQCAHASLASVTKHLHWIPTLQRHILDLQNNDALRDWLFDGPFVKIVVSCDSEEELLELRDKGVDYGLPCSLIQDAGTTEFHGVPTFTVLAVGPEEEEKVNKITGHLKLL